MKRIQFAGLLSVLLLQGCGMKSLDRVERERFATTLGRMSNTLNAVERVSSQYSQDKKVKGTDAQKALSAFVPTLPGKPTPSSKQTEENGLLIKEKLQKAAMNGECIIPTQLPEEVVPSIDGKSLTAKDIPSVVFEMKGEKCPITLFFEIKAHGDSTANTAEVVLVYEILDEEMKALADISKADLKGTVRSETSGDMSTSISVLSELSLAGILFSAREGQIRTRLNMGSEFKASLDDGTSKGTAEMVLALGFKDFPAELRASFETRAGKVDESYYLNDERISVNEFNGLMAGRTFSRKSDNPSIGEDIEDLFH